MKLWERIKGVLDTCDGADHPGPWTFILNAYDGRRQLRHPQIPGLLLSRP
ncbi:hypothetical protein ACWD4T_14420 [Streptomyces umbrinus]